MASLGEQLVTAFNGAMKNFLHQLSETFPEQRDVAAFLASFDTFVAVMPSKPLDGFMEAVAPHAALLTARDPALFRALEFPGIDFLALWESPGVTANTHNAIWQHLNLLFFLGTVTKGLTPDKLEAIEAQTRHCTGPDGQIDQQELMRVLPGLIPLIMDSDMGGALGSGLLAFAGGGGGEAQPRKPAAAGRHGRPDPAALMGLMGLTGMLSGGGEGGEGDAAGLLGLLGGLGAGGEGDAAGLLGLLGGEGGEGDAAGLLGLLGGLGGGGEAQPRKPAAAGRHGRPRRSGHK